ncbi:hypothetical protein IQ266_24595 [filamentous cyanobacterium LEGE 11480]|uniref:Uncharacterized protein n=1 Tax=Romeriopsis navalis LEGE 11480 TaxID=2777977 RepID=A0A928VVP9_9CYAN|nr:hypothetical protein [Romeriopsis navalis]MBE9032919.1 hypothetical protein [Romeriopsis navalis LEGE 11480]
MKIIKQTLDIIELAEQSQYHRRFQHASSIAAAIHIACIAYIGILKPDTTELYCNRQSTIATCEFTNTSILGIQQQRSIPISQLKTVDYEVAIQRQQVVISTKDGQKVRLPDRPQRHVNQPDAIENANFRKIKHFFADPNQQQIKISQSIPRHSYFHIGIFCWIVSSWIWSSLQQQHSIHCKLDKPQNQLDIQYRNIFRHFHHTFKLAEVHYIQYRPCKIGNVDLDGRLDYVALVLKSGKTLRLNITGEVVEVITTIEDFLNLTS